MKTIRILSFLFTSILLSATFAASSKASLVWDFGFIGSQNNFSGTGSLALGGSTSGDGLDAFEYSGNCGENRSGTYNTCSFGLEDVEIALWILNDDWTFKKLFIVAKTDDNQKHGLALTNFSLFSDCKDFKKWECNDWFYSAGFGKFHKDDAFLKAVHEVAEPGTAAMFLSGLLGLFGMVSLYRRRQG